MKKICTGIALSLALSLTAAPAVAGGGYFDKGDFKKVSMIKEKFKESKVKKFKKSKKKYKVPEIDAATAPLALAFVGGAIALRRERRKHNVATLTQ